MVGLETESGQHFLARLYDGLNLNRYGRGVLALPELTKKWFAALKTAINTLPDKIQQAGEILKKAADNLEPAAKTIDDFWNEPGKASIRALRNIGRAMQAFGKPGAPPEIDPEIQKKAERKATALLKVNQPVPDDIAINVRELNLSWSDFSQISLLANFPYVQRLNFHETQISDISALKGMTQLETLDLSSTQISDISVLEGMTQLQRLYLSHTQISDISMLKGMTQLHSLYLDGTNIRDIKVLATLKQLNLVSLIDTSVTDWSPLDHLVKVPGRPRDWVRKTNSA